MYEVFEKLCENAGISAYKVSKETGVSTATLTSWKQGKYAPKEEKLKKIADYFNVTTEYIKTGKVTENENTQGYGSLLMDIATDKELMNALTNLTKLDQADRDFVIAMINRLSK